MTTKLLNAVKVALERLAKKGYDYTDRKIYTLAELDWGSTYGFGEGGSKPDSPYASPGAVYMIQGSPCRGVVVVFPSWQGWLVHVVNSHFHRKFIISFEEVPK